MMKYSPSKHHRKSSSESTPSPEPGLRQPMKHRRTVTISNEPHWSSLPEQPEYAEDQDDPLEPGNGPGVRRTSSMNIHEKRRVMMAKMREHKTLQGAHMFNLPSQGQVRRDDGAPVPPELLERKRILQRTLQRVRSQQNWSSLPSAMNRSESATPPPFPNTSTGNPVGPRSRYPPHPDGRKLMRCNSAAIVNSAPKRRELPRTPGWISSPIKHSIQTQKQKCSWIAKKMMGLGINK